MKNNTLRLVCAGLWLVSGAVWAQAQPAGAAPASPPTLAAQMAAPKAAAPVAGVPAAPSVSGMVAPAAAPTAPAAAPAIPVQNLAPEQYAGQYPGATAPGAVAPINPVTGAPVGAPATAGPVAGPNPFGATGGQYPVSQYPTGQVPVQAVPQAGAPQQGVPVNAQQLPPGANPYGANPYGTARAPQAAPTALPPLPTVSGQVANVVEDYFGMTPEQIRDLRKTVDARQKAAADLPDPPKPVTGSIRVDMTPGSVPPPIRTYMDSVSTFIVVDSTGEPWPVENFRVGNASLFQVYRLDAAQGSSFTIQTSAPYGQSNLVLKLAGVATPVVINLVAGQKELDARVEVRVQGRGPNAKSVAGTTLPAGTDARLLPILDGVPPDGGVRLKTSVDGVTAWMLPNGRMVVRAPMPIVEPATTEFVSSSDGTYVYTFVPVPKLLGRANGQFIDIDVGNW